MATPEYGVGISNPFDALGEDNAALKKAPKEGDEKKKGIAPAPKPADKKTDKKVAAVAPAEGTEQRPKYPLDANNKQRGRGTGRGGRGGRGRGRGRGAGPAGSEGTGNRPPKRLYDRHSGTGRGKEVRKGGYGGYGAEGTFQDDLAAGQEVEKLDTKKEGEQKKEGEAAAPATDAAAPAAEEKKAEEKHVETEEEKKAREEDEANRKLKTFEQVQAELAKKKVADDLKVSVRQVQNDDKSFKACQLMKKKSDTIFADEPAKEEPAAEAKDEEADQKDDKKKKAKKSAKTVMHLDAFKAEGGEQPAAQQSRPPREDRGEFRGRGRGGRGRGGRGGRGGAGASFTEVDFPKLGAKKQ